MTRHFRRCMSGLEQNKTRQSKWINYTLANMGQLVGESSHSQSCGLIPGQGTYLGWGFHPLSGHGDPWFRHEWSQSKCPPPWHVGEATNDASLFHDISVLYLSFPPSLKAMEISVLGWGYTHTRLCVHMYVYVCIYVYICMYIYIYKNYKSQATWKNYDYFQLKLHHLSWLLIFTMITLYPCHCF